MSVVYVEIEEWSSRKRRSNKPNCFKYSLEKDDPYLFVEKLMGIKDLDTVSFVYDLSHETDELIDLKVMINSNIPMIILKSK
jgi:hypothetical protein